jgi:hypothetical protein
MTDETSEDSIPKESAKTNSPFPAGREAKIDICRDIFASY